MKKGIMDRLTLGVAYYPEHWDASLWEEDILRMKEHGLTVLRIGDFAWAKYEPREGEWNIGYFDPFLTLCQKHGMTVIFCTPTAAPPMWMARQYPEILNCDREGRPYDGPRRHYNYNSPVYRRFCSRLVEKLAEHYAQWDGIIGWQIDNELNCDLNEFCSASDHQAYREYLKAKFGSLEQVNDALGLTFWSRSYSDWDQVTLNKKSVGGAVNPHLALEEKRFFSQSAVSFCAMQVEILRKHLPRNIFLTTNGLFAHLDYNRLLEYGLDFITFDSYPNFAFDLDKDPAAPGNLNDRKWSWNLMWTRSVSPVFGIMEQQAGANGWSTRMETPMPKPGQMKLWTLQSIAHGADLVAYFRWRTSPMGCEIYWHGLNDYANTDNRRLRELKEISRALEGLQGLRGSTYQAKVAVLKDYDNLWDAEGDCWHGRVERHSDDSWFEATQLSHTPCDFLFLRPETKLEELARYDVLAYPHAAILTPQADELLRVYVEQGGTLVLGARTGYKDEFGRCPMRPMPGLVSRWCGVTVTDYTLVGPADGEIKMTWGERCLGAPVFNEVLAPEETGVEVLARFQGNYAEGQPALCRKALGKGRVYYAGSCFSQELVRAILEEEGALAPYRQALTLPETVELAVRRDEKAAYLFALNYRGETAEIRLHRPMRELISGEDQVGAVVLKPYEGKVFLDTKPAG